MKGGEDVGLSTEQSKRRSFEAFRDACGDVDIVTFDERFAELVFLEKQLKPREKTIYFELGERERSRGIPPRDYARCTPNRWEC